MKLGTQPLLAAATLVALAMGGCGYDYSTSEDGAQAPGSQAVPAPAPDLPTATENARQADIAVRQLTADVLSAGDAMETAAAAFEAALEQAETNESLAALDLAVADALLAIEDADAAAIAADQIAYNLVVIATAANDAIGFLPTAGPEGPALAQEILELAEDAEANADAAFAALDTALEVAEDLGSDTRAAQLEVEVALAESAAALLEGAEGAIEGAEGAVDAAVESLSLALGAP